MRNNQRICAFIIERRVYNRPMQHRRHPVISSHVAPQALARIDAAAARAGQSRAGFMRAAALAAVRQAERALPAELRERAA
jgi:hypothetical protein